MSPGGTGLGRGGIPPVRRDGAVACCVVLAAAVILGPQILSLPDYAGQFSKYPLAALQLVHGTVDADRLADFSPLYLALHSLVFPRLADPVPVLLGIQTAFLSLAAGFLFLLLRRGFGTGASLAGAAGLVLLRSVPVYGYVFEPEALILLALTAAAWCAGGKGLPAAAGAGAALTVAFLCRMSFLPLALVVPLAMLAAEGKGRRTAARAALFLLPVGAGLALLAAGDLPRGRLPIPVAMNPGVVFFDGNNPLASGRGVAYPEVVADLAYGEPGEADYQHVAYRELARRDAGRPLSVPEVNRYWSSRALAFLADHPGHAARLLGRKLLFILHGYRWHDLRVAEAADRHLAGIPVPALPYAPVAALALAGLVAGAPRWREHLVPGAVVLCQSGVMLATYASDRQRVALLPFLVYFALVGLRWIAGAGRRGVAVAAAVAVLAAGLTVRTDLMRDNARTWDAVERLGGRLSAADGAVARGDLAGAAGEIAAAAALSPWLVDWIRPARLPFGAGGLAGAALGRFAEVRGDDAASRLDRSLLLIEAGRLDEARGILSALDRDGTRFERIYGRVAEPAYHLGRIAALSGDRAGARTLMERALAGSPGDPDILAASAALGDGAAAARLPRYTDTADGLMALGLAHLRLGTPAEAVGPLGRLVTLVPESRRARLHLAWALGAAGRDEEAAAAALAALEESPAPVLLEERIVPILRRFAGGNPGDCGALRRAGAALRLYGRFDETIALFGEGVRLGCPGASEGLEATRKLAAGGP